MTAVKMGDYDVLMPGASMADFRERCRLLGIRQASEVSDRWQAVPYDQVVDYACDWCRMPPNAWLLLNG